jgi:hypothetical protein
MNREMSGTTAVATFWAFESFIEIHQTFNYPVAR